MRSVKLTRLAICKSCGLKRPSSKTFSYPRVYPHRAIRLWKSSLSDRPCKSCKGQGGEVVYTIIGRHTHWVSGAKITESLREGWDKGGRQWHRFTATINGWKGWVIYDGYMYGGVADEVADEVRRIREDLKKANGNPNTVHESKLLTKKQKVE